MTNQNSKEERMMRDLFQMLRDTKQLSENVHNVVRLNLPQTSPGSFQTGKIGQILNPSTIFQGIDQKNQDL